MGFQTQWLLFKLLGEGEPFVARFDQEVRARIPDSHRLTRNGSIWIQWDTTGQPVNLWMPWWARPRWWLRKWLTTCREDP